MPDFSRRNFLAASLGGSLAALRGWPALGFDGDSDPAAANEKIRSAREIALDILQPSEAQLQHGLKLHAESLVFDAYGFAPRAALDGDRMRRAIEEGASPLELQDLREDMSMTRVATDPREEQEFRQAFEAAGVTCIFQNAGEEGQDPMRLLKRLARFTYTTDLLRDFVRRAVTPEDIVAAHEAGRHALYFSGNGVPLVQDWESVPDELRYVRVFFQLGIRMMHVTYNRRNMLGDGCAERANGGLSDFGRAAVKEMNRVGVIVDVAHSGWQTSLESAQVSEKPMVASHTACVGLHNHIRNKPAEVIKAICDTGGLIGICCIPSYLGGDGDIKALLDHVDYMTQRFGVDHVAIGTDVAYTSRHAAQENRKVPRRPKTRTPWRSLWPPDAFIPRKKEHESIVWTNWPLFTVGLVQRGYKDEDIQKILGGNVMRVARAALPEEMRG